MFYRQDADKEEREPISELELRRKLEGWYDSLDEVINGRGGVARTPFAYYGLMEEQAKGE